VPKYRGGAAQVLATQLIQALKAAKSSLWACRLLADFSFSPNRRRTSYSVVVSALGSSGSDHASLSPAGAGDIAHYAEKSSTSIDPDQ
jgi:hypothetical protein